IRTRSVWPAALGHSTINAIGGLPLIFSADTTFDTAHVGITGTTGWIVAGIVLVVLLLLKSFKPAPVPAVDPRAAWPSDYMSSSTFGPQEQLAQSYGAKTSGCMNQETSSMLISSGHGSRVWKRLATAPTR